MSISGLLLSEKADAGAEVPVCQLGAINRHNRRLFDDFVGAQQDRWGYGKTERRGGLSVHGHLVAAGARFEGANVALAVDGGEGDAG